VYDGPGQPPYEALADGVRVVTTRAGARPDGAGDGADLVEVGDVDGLAATLARVLDDPGHRADLVTRGHAVAACYDWATAADQLADLFRLANATATT
jgi:glycosyltransferase involved in cell wall biosynthesis